MIKFIAILLLSLTSAGCATVRSVDVTAYSRHDAIDASVYELLASPERFDGRSVRVIGVVKFSFAFESQSGIYATPDDYLHNTQGLIEINSFDPAFPLNEQSLSDISGTYAIVEGVFHARPPIPEKSSDLSSSICIGKCWGGGFIESINRVSSWQY